MKFPEASTYVQKTPNGYEYSLKDNALFCYFYYFRHFSIIAYFMVGKSIY